MRLRAKGIKHLAVWVYDEDQFWVTSLDNFFDRTKIHFLNYESRGGAQQRYLNLDYFKPGPARIKKL